jgi:hypothetical protein
MSLAIAADESPIRLMSRVENVALFKVAVENHHVHEDSQIKSQSGAGTMVNYRAGIVRASRHCCLLNPLRICT